MRSLILAVTGLALFTACSTYDTSVEIVSKTPVASVSVALPLPTLTAGQTERGVAVARDASGVPLPGRAVTWRSSNTLSATVDDSGMVAAVAPGAAMITASSEGVTGQGALSVMASPPIPVAGVSVALAASSIIAGQTTTATATLRDANGNPLSGRAVAWQTSNQGVAAVSASGQVSGLSAGTATITASSEGQSGSAALTVTAPPQVAVATVSVSPSAPSILTGGTVQLVAVTRDESGNTLSGRVVTWSSANTGIATVSSSGSATGVSAGTTTITATSEGQTGNASVTVTAVPVASVTVSPTAPSLLVGATVQLSAVTRDVSGNLLTGRVVTWSSSTTSVATVNSSGLVTGVGAGTATITATSEGRTGTAVATVTLAPVATVSVSPAAPNILVGGAVQLAAVTRDASGNVLTGRTVTWTSGNSSIGTVSTNGLVTGIAAGGTTITATSGTASGTASLTVSVAPPPPVITAPEPVAGDVILWQDNFDKSSVTALTDPYATRGDIALTDGRTGQAARFIYSGSSYDNLIEKAFPTTTDIYFRYWYRLSPGADPTCGDRGGSGMKWFMAWRPDPAPRYTMGVGTLDGGPVSAQPNMGNEFTTHDNSSSQMPNPFLSNINKSLRFSTTNDGRWHEYTLHIVTGNGGYEQIWVDGVLVLDNSSYHYDHSSIGIAMVNFPGTLVQWFSGCDFTIDVDDLAIWHK